MKDLLIRAVKRALGVMPEWAKHRMRQHHQLREWYGNKLRKSSIAYEVPTLKKTRQLHRILLAHQAQKFGCNESKVSLDVCILGTAGISSTLASLNGIADIISAVYCSGDEAAAQDANYPFKIKSVANIGKRDSSCPVLFISSGNEVSQEAFRYISQSSADFDVLYFDSYIKSPQGKLLNYEFLPAWNPELFLSTAYVHRAVLVSPDSSIEKAIVERNCIATGLLSAWLKYPALNIRHRPFSAISCTKLDTSVAHDALTVTQELIENSGASVVSRSKDLLKIMWPLPTSPLVSLIIPTYNGMELVKACIKSILDKTTYPHYEILLVDNNSNDPECLKYFDELDKHPKIRLLKYPYPFNYSAINNFAVKQAKGEVIGLVNNDIEVITPNWLEYMAGHAMREDIGCVGAKLLYTDGRIQHAGVVMGYGNGAGHAHKYFPRHHPGYMNRLIATQNYSAVTAACLLVKKSKYEEVGGLNEEDLQVAFNDVDFCLKVLETGVRNVYCAEAELFHHESVSRGLDISEEKAARFNRELQYLRTTWKKYIDNDPAYNPNLTRKRENFSIKFKEEY